jgi:hypothetical protein
MGDNTRMPVADGEGPNSGTGRHAVIRRRAKYEHNEQLRRFGYVELVDVLADKHPLRPGLTRTKARDVLLVLTGPPAVRAIHPRPSLDLPRARHVDHRGRPGTGLRPEMSAPSTGGQEIPAADRLTDDLLAVLSSRTDRAAARRLGFDLKPPILSVDKDNKPIS